MNGEEKRKLIQSWIEQDNRVTVDFWDELGLVAEVAGCTDEQVELRLDTDRLDQQIVTIPLDQIRIGEDHSPFHCMSPASHRRSRLRLSADQERQGPAPLSRSR
jgi:hypothetical protein